MQNTFMERRKMKSFKQCFMLLVMLMVGGVLLLPVGTGDLLYAQSVVGTWECPNVMTPWGLAHGKTILMPDGTFTKTVRCGEMMTWDKGTYTTGTGYIHYKIQDHEPKIYKGQQMHWPKEETSYFEFAGSDRIVSSNRDGGARVECYRVR
jgi:hypothetical protein